MLITIDRLQFPRADRFRGNKDNSFDDDTNKPVFFRNLPIQVSQEDWWMESFLVAVDPVMEYRSWMERIGCMVDGRVTTIHF